MKYCSTCGQEIQDEAIRCRHCKNWLVATSPAGNSYVAAAPVSYSTTSGLAIASMVLGILWIYWIGSLVGLVLGYLALREIRQDPQRIGGKGMAIAGIVLGWIGALTLLLAVALGLYVWKHREPQHIPAGISATHAYFGEPGLVSGSGRG
jgi:hypothetical protein